MLVPRQRSSQTRLLMIGYAAIVPSSRARIACRVRAAPPVSAHPRRSGAKPGRSRASRAIASGDPGGTRRTVAARRRDAAAPCWPQPPRGRRATADALARRLLQHVAVASPGGAGRAAAGLLREPRAAVEAVHIDLVWQDARRGTRRAVARPRSQARSAAAPPRGAPGCPGPRPRAGTGNARCVQSRTWGSAVSSAFQAASRPARSPSKQNTSSGVARNSSLQVLGRGGGAQGGHALVDAELGQGDHVHVALDHQQRGPAGAPPGGPRTVRRARGPCETPGSPGSSGTWACRRRARGRRSR